jgi:hypothetical protein
MPESEFTCATFGGSCTYGLPGLAGSEITVVIAIEGDNDKIGHRHLIVISSSSALPERMLGEGLFCLLEITSDLPSDYARTARRRSTRALKHSSTARGSLEVSEDA